MKKVIEFGTPQFVEKVWGGEVIVANNDKYCGKILQLKAGSGFSMHYHLNKHETFYLLKGVIRFRCYDLETAEIKEYVILPESATITIPPGNPHQIFAVEDTEIMEVSTHHDDYDSYRIVKGSGQI